MQVTDRRDPSKYDVVVVGGGTAGLSAALVLGRSRRWVLVLDGGEPRNAPSSAVHGFFTRDGLPPDEPVRTGREQLKPYWGVEVRSTRAIGARAENGGSSAQPRLFGLAEGLGEDGWLKALKLQDYAARSPRSSGMQQQVLFTYTDAV